MHTRRTTTRFASIGTLAITAAGLLLLLAAPLQAAEEAEQEKKVEVKANALRLEVPKSWKQVPSRSRMRAAQFSIAPEEGEGNEAELIVFYFGGGDTGGTKANLERWIGQFQPKDREVTLRTGQFQQGQYVLADIAGTWKKPEGPFFAQKTVDTPNSRVINVIAIVTNDGQKDHYFLKLAGPDKLVKNQADALREALGVKPDSEKELKLEDVKN